MRKAKHSTDAQLLARACRLAPSDGERFAAWFASLRPQQRTETLAPLQALLSGLVAFRHLENHALPVSSNGLRAQLQAVHASYRWALELAQSLAGSTAPTGLGPNSSLLSLVHSLSDALRVSERLVELPVVHAEDFIASFDLFLRDLRHNAFFAPPDPLELTHACELAVPEELAPELSDFSSESAKMTTMVAFVTLLRAHRFLGIADRYVSGPDGLFRAQIILSAVRRELRTLTRFLLVQGVESLVDDYAARHEPCSPASVESFRKSIELISMDIHTQMRVMLDEALPELDAGGSPALDVRRFHHTVSSAREAVKGYAKRLRWLATEHSSSAIAAPRDDGAFLRLREELWGFRFVLWAFSDKVAAALRAGQADFAFVEAFERHFEAFGPRLATQTQYPHKGPLLHSISMLKAEPGAAPKRLRRARQECLRFCVHLNASFAKLLAEPALADHAFDKSAAASRLRNHLRANARRSLSSPMAHGAVGLLDQAQTGRTRASA